MISESKAYSQRSQHEQGGYSFYSVKAPEGFHHRGCFSLCQVVIVFPQPGTGEHSDDGKDYAELGPHLCQLFGMCEAFYYVVKNEDLGDYHGCCYDEAGKIFQLAITIVVIGAVASIHLSYAHPCEESCQDEACVF